MLSAPGDGETDPTFVHSETKKRFYTENPPMRCTDATSHVPTRCAGDKRASDSYQSRTIPSNTIESKLAPTSTATNRLSGLIPKQYRDHYWNAVRVLGAGESDAASNAKPPLGLTAAASPNGACDQAKWLKSPGRSRFLSLPFSRPSSAWPPVRRFQGPLGPMSRAGGLTKG